MTEKMAEKKRGGCSRIWRPSSCGYANSLILLVSATIFWYLMDALEEADITVTPSRSTTVMHCTAGRERA